MTENQKVFIIGGSGSLGSEICRVMAEKGFDIAFTYYKHPEKADALVKELSDAGKKACAFQMDLADLDGIATIVEKCWKELGGIDSLIVASGISSAHFQDGQPFIPKFFEITPEGYDRMTTVNVRGVFFLCQKVALLMSEKMAGKIVIIGSIDGIKSVPSPVDYACCKAALWGLTQSLCKALGKYNILVNMVAPGIMEGGSASLLSDELLQEYIKHCCLKRVGKFSEIARMCAFLASTKNTYLTGQAIILDGGL